MNHAQGGRRIGAMMASSACSCALTLIVGAAIAADDPPPPPVPAAANANSTQRITPNFKDADITQIAEAVSAATGKNFILDPRVRAQVTMLSSTPMSPDAFYQAFLSILQVHGFVALPAGKVIKIVPDANARQYPSNDLPDKVSASSDEIVTQVISVKNVNAAQLVPILRPLIPQYGHLAAYPASNILIISDRANNVNRIAHHPAHRSGRRFGRGGRAAAERLGDRSRARHQLPVSAAGRDRRRLERLQTRRR
jgi:type II secretory pathway component GspD/PulD (secretin)